MGVTSKENKEQIVSIIIDTIESIKKKQQEDYNRELATIVIGLNSEKSASPISLKTKEIDGKYKEIFYHLKSQRDSGVITNIIYDSLVDDAELKKQQEKHALLISGIKDFKTQEYALNKEWDDKIALAKEGSSVIRELMAGKDNALNTLRLEAVKGMSEWSELFTNLDSLSISEIGKLSKSIREKSKELKLDPVKSGEVVKELDKAEAEIRSRNPFSSLLKSIKDYKSAENETFKDNALKNIFMDSASSFDMVKGSLTAVTSGLDELGLSGNEATKEVLGDITNLMGGFSEIATGFATKNPVAILKGTMGVFTSVFNLFDGRSRFANKIIKENAVELKKLEESYKSLEEAMKSALGEDHFKHQVDQVKNLATQQEKIQNQFDAENSKSKKKKDNKKLEEYQKAKKDLEYQADDLKRNLLKDLLTTDVGSFAKTIADDIMKGFEKGFANASGVVDKSVDDLMKKIIAHQFEVLVVQKAMIPFQNKAEKAAEDGSFTDQEIKDLSNTAKGAKDEIAEGWKAYETLLKDMKLEPDGSTPKDSTQTTSGQLQASMTEGTASALVGLWNSSSLDIRRLKEIAETQRTEPVPVEIYNPESNELQTLQGLTDEQLQQARSGADSVRELLSQSMLIEQNTRRTADNTGTIITELQSGFGKLEGQLTSIERNTKGSKSRA